jgi:very-short-patch-repair endonuclease
LLIAAGTLPSRYSSASTRSFRRQQPVAGFVVDFYCPSQRLVLELDGDVHDEPDRRERDRLRTEALRQLSIRVLRVPNHDVHDQALRDLLEPFARPARAR